MPYLSTELSATTERALLGVADALEGVDDQCPELRVVEIARDVRRAVRWCRSAEVGHRHPERESASEFDIQGHANRLHDRRIDHEGNSAWIVNGRVVEALLVFVRLPEKLQQLAHESRGRGVDGGDCGSHIRGRERFVCEIEANHRERPRLVEDDVRRFGVDDDVELARRAPVADVESATHEHDLLDAGGNTRFLAHGHRDVREGTGGNQRYLAGLGGHDGVDDEVDSMPWIKFDLGIRKHRTVEPRLAVNRLGDLDSAHEWSVRSLRERNPRDPGYPRDRESVAGDLFDGLVPHDGGDADEFDLGISVGQEQGDCVVVAGIAVENDLRGHGYEAIAQHVTR